MQGVAVVPMGPSLEMDKAIQNVFSEAPEQDPLKKKKSLGLLGFPQVPAARGLNKSLSQQQVFKAWLRFDATLHSVLSRRVPRMGKSLSSSNSRWEKSRQNSNKLQRGSINADERGMTRK